MAKKVVNAEPPREATKTKTRYVTQAKDSLDIKRYESCATLSAIVSAWALAYFPETAGNGATLVTEPKKALLIASCGTAAIQLYVAMHFRGWYMKDERDRLKAAGNDGVDSQEQEEIKKDRFALPKRAGQSLLVCLFTSDLCIHQADCELFGSLYYKPL